MLKKVLHISMSSGKGGLELYVGRVAKDLTQLGWEVYSINLENTKVSEYMEKEGIESLTFASNFASILSFLKVVRWIKKNKISVIHCHKSSDLRLALVIKPFLQGVRIFYTDHVGGSSSKKDPYHRLAYSAVERVFSISDATYVRNVKNLPISSRRISRLHHGIDVEKYIPYSDSNRREEKRRNLNIPAKSVAVGLPARVTPGKGQEIWIKALAKIPESLPIVAFSIGGIDRDSGGTEEYYEKMIRLANLEKISNRVVFLGHRDDLHEIIPAMDIICIPSRNEAFGLTVIESMAAGAAVIGSSSGALPELLGEEGGVLVDPSDVDAWARAIENLAQDETLRQSLGYAARKRAVNYFSKGAHVSALESYYMETNE